MEPGEYLTNVLSSVGIVNRIRNTITDLVL